MLDTKNLPSKHQRERDALKKIQKRFSNFKTLTKTIEKYEKRTDDESKFIYALDKLIPPIQIYMEGGKLFHEKKISLENVIEIKKGKIDMSPHINKYWQELLPELRKNKKKLFPLLD